MAPRSSGATPNKRGSLRGFTASSAPSRTGTVPASSSFGRDELDVLEDYAPGGLYDGDDVVMTGVLQLTFVNYSDNSDIHADYEMYTFNEWTSASALDIATLHTTGDANRQERIEIAHRLLGMDETERYNEEKRDIDAVIRAPKRTDLYTLQRDFNARTARTLDMQAIEDTGEAAAIDAITDGGPMMGDMDDEHPNDVSDYIHAPDDEDLPLFDDDDSDPFGYGDINMTGFGRRGLAKGSHNPRARRFKAASPILVDHPRLTHNVLSTTKYSRELFHDPYLRQNYIEDCCWFTCIIEFVNSAMNNTIITYDLLYRIMYGKEASFPASLPELTKGFSVDEMIPIFDYFDRHVVVYASLGGVIYERQRSVERKRNHIRPERWEFLVTEDHVYMLRSRKRNVTDERCEREHPSILDYDGINYKIRTNPEVHEYERVSPLYPRYELAPPRQLDDGCLVLFYAGSHGHCNEDLSNKGYATLPDIMMAPAFDGLSLFVIVDGDLITNVAAVLCDEYKYRPSIDAVGFSVTSVRLSSVEGRKKIHFTRSKIPIMQCMQDFPDLDIIELYKQYTYMACTLNQTMMSSLYRSTFNEQTVRIMQQYVRGGLIGYLGDNYHDIYLNEPMSSLDVNRLYPSTLLTPNLPVCSCFTQFEPVKDGSAIIDTLADTDLLLCEVRGQATIYAERPVILTFAKNLRQFIRRADTQLVGVTFPPNAHLDQTQSHYITYIKIHAVMITIPVDAQRVNAALNTLWDDQSTPRILRKYAMNSCIGKFGTKCNTRVGNTMIFMNEDEANIFAEHNCGQVIRILDDFFIATYPQERVPRLEGGYLLHLWVLDSARMSMQTVYDTLIEHNVDVVYACVDEFYFPSKDLPVVQHLIYSDPDSFDGFGKLKLGKHEVYLSEQGRSDRTVVGSSFLRDLSNSMTDTMDKISLYSIDTSCKIEVNDEFHMKDLLESHPRLLIEADTPGAGKSSAILRNYSTDTLVVTPTNSLAVEHSKSFEGCQSLTLHKYLRQGRLDSTSGTIDTDEQSFVDGDSNKLGVEVDQPEDGKVLLLDEIYMYSLKSLVFLYYRLSISRAVRIYATGDLNQLPPVDTTHKDDRNLRIQAVQALFKKFVVLTKCKRLGSDTECRRMEQICNKIRTTPESSVLIRYVLNTFKTIRIQQVAELMKKSDDMLAVCYYNHTCNRICRDTMGDIIRPGMTLVNRLYTRVGKGYAMNVNFEFTIVSVPEVEAVMSEGDGKRKRTKKQFIDMEDGEGTVIHVPRAHVEKHMQWYRTRTCHSVQGCSINAPIVICDILDKRITPAFIYVALTRARSLGDVYIAI